MLVLCYVVRPSLLTGEDWASDWPLIESMAVIVKSDIHVDV